ncbi:serum paraoxonase/arylesterase family protein [Ophiocordyceps camponoti-floridani]|uniref:Serum paraoxonase/arylesterase family protein n=1 Tax=Ophiocordyceps camponoti-floridani TaxID=2030778 RepID=A0A8H4Q280_9HYPO|nr:serum paraoxonase/arylesterase family protein [Ophiocordyceps camponoti-floridani]
MASNRSFYSTSLIVLLIAVSVSYLCGATFLRMFVVLGVFRTPGQTPAADLVAIPDTTYCEDLHYHKPSGFVFAACEGETIRHSWFPPLSIFDDPARGYKGRGGVKVIDPTTLKAKTLRLDGFDGPFVTHGFDILDDPESQEGKHIYLFAVNHKPNTQRYEKRDESAPESHSVIEVFRHELGSDSAQHVRSVWHPLIKTPNDVYALSPSSFFVTNDHRYTKGVMRLVEESYFASKWTDTIFVQFTPSESAQDDSHGVQASVALQGLHNNNGLGHGKAPQDILVVSASTGQLHLGVHAVDATTVTSRIRITESIDVDSTIDNPSYFSDPYANSTFDGSGFVLAGLSNGVNVLSNRRNPDAKDGVLIWMVSPEKGAGKDSSKWRKRLLFEDDGTRIRTASSAVLVAKDPAADSGRRRAQLFVSGFLSKSVVSCLVDL